MKESQKNFEKIQKVLRTNLKKKIDGNFVKF